MLFLERRRASVAIGRSAGVRVLLVSCGMIELSGHGSTCDSESETATAESRALMNDDSSSAGRWGRNESGPSHHVQGRGRSFASARRYSERPPSPMHRSPRLMTSRALLRRRMLARCMNAKLCRVFAESSLNVDKNQNASRLPFVPTSISAQFMSRLFLRLSLLLVLAILIAGP